MRETESDITRRVLSTNAVTTAVTGFVVAVAAGPIDGILGTGQVGVVRLVGIGLMAFALLVYAVSRATGAAFGIGLDVVAVLDIGWVIASVAAVALGWFHTLGSVLVIAVAVVVATFAYFEVRGLLRPGSTPA